MNRVGQLTLDTSALRHNLDRVRVLAPRSRIMAMVKADAYGHGLIAVAALLTDLIDGLSVACMAEAVRLREARLDNRILVLQGFRDARELKVAIEYRLDVVIHAAHQLQWLQDSTGPRLPSVWIKIDTGMHRLGFMPTDIAGIDRILRGLAGLPELPRFLTHFACADDPENPATTRQIRCFDDTVKGLPGERSLANSAAILTRPETQRDWVRPGIMLYGSSPLPDVDALALDLRPVMTLIAPLIAIRECPAGEAIGYGGTDVCPETMPIGVVGVGYGDGYPRHASNETPVWINGRWTQLIGRVSMDMLCIDLRGIPAHPGDPVVLWGAKVSVDTVAQHAGTIGYELLCQVGGRNQRIWK